MMVALLTSLLFSVTLVAAIWSMWITIQPRIGYMRTLLSGDTPPAAVPVPARARISLRPAVRTLPVPALRAAA